MPGFHACSTSPSRTTRNADAASWSIVRSAGTCLDPHAWGGPCCAGCGQGCRPDVGPQPRTCELEID